MHRPATTLVALGVVGALATAAAVSGPAGLIGQRPPDATSVGSCAMRAAASQPAPDADLYCIELFHTPDFPQAAGRVELGRVRSPFGTRVTAAGHHEFELTMHLAGLPDVSTVGPYATYVAWATTPFLRPMLNLGAVANGRAALGPIAFDKFMILVTAERSAEVDTRQGRLILRGISASMRMEPEDFLQLTGIAAVRSPTPREPTAPSGWVDPPGHPLVPMMPGVSELTPRARPFLPSSDGSSPIPAARPRDVVKLGDGGTLDLDAGLVQRTINGRTFTMYGFNGQYPGPLIQVPQDATITVNFTNRLDLPTSVHWHGVRLDNRFDGVPGVTQDPVAPGETFQYRIRFPDAGLYWYHPHHREDIQQDLGLYGNMRVDARDPDYFGAVNREQVLMLDDLLIADEGLVPFGLDRATHALMGRFGNVLLVNGEPDYELTVRRGEVVRFFLTNVSNTRTFNLSFGPAPIKLVGSDIGKFERETWVDSVVISPAERFIVEVRFAEPGEVAVTNGIQGIDHVYGNFFPESETLGRITVDASPAQPDHSATFHHLRAHDEVVADIDRYRPEFARRVDHRLLLTLQVEDLPYPLETLLNLDSVFFSPVEWSGTMRRMNWITTSDQVHWILRDLDTGQENTDITWAFTLGDLVKLRLSNDRAAVHAMQHPIHIHGQRFLILSQDGVANENLVWKDTMLLPVGSTADLLLELSNPGRWMLHCHIAEHLESGMKMVFTVNPSP